MAGDLNETINAVLATMRESIPGLESIIGMMIERSQLMGDDEYSAEVFQERASTVEDIRDRLIEMANELEALVDGE